MKGWLIYSSEDAKRNDGLIRIYHEESKAMGIDLILILTEKISIGIENGILVLWYDGVRAEPPIFAICRTIDITLTTQLESIGVSVFNNSNVAHICNDKALTYQIVTKNNVNIVDSIFVDCHRKNSLCFDFPFVIKSARGRGGTEVFLVENEEQYNAVLPKLSDSSYIIQRLSGTIGQDLRVYVLGKEIVASILRKSDNDFRANFCLGGQASAYNLSNEEKDIIQRIIYNFDFGLVGIDFLFDKDGKILFNEIEDVVGARALYLKTDINIAKEYLLYINKKLKESIEWQCGKSYRIV